MKKLLTKLSTLAIILFLFQGTVFAKYDGKPFTDTAINKVWTVQMTNNVDYTTLDDNTVFVTNNTTHEKIPVTLSPVPNNPKAFLIQPKRNYDYSTTYTITLKGLKSAKGKSMEAERTVTFTTVAKSETPINIGSAPDKSLSDQQYAYEVTKELSENKYQGRLVGTNGYKASADYIASVFSSLGLNTVDNNYLESYPASIAQLNSMPTIKINNKTLTMFTDYKLHGNTPSANINSNQIVFVGNGYSEDYNVDVKGKIVLFKADVKTGNSMGVLDRVNIAAQKGAITALMIPSQYMPITTAEKPLKYEQGSIPCIYITRDVSSNTIGLNVDSSNLGTFKTATVQMTIDVNRNKVNGYNVLGMIKGKDTTKTIVISASLDGYGSLPNGRVFPGASADASGVGTIAAVAKYFSTNQPNYNVLFAAFGSQTAQREGSIYFVNNYSNIKNVIADIDIYDVGNSNGMLFNAVKKEFTDLHDTIAKQPGIHLTDTGADANYPFGNSYDFASKDIPSAFVRFGETSDSLKDTISTIDINKLGTVINEIKNVITQYPYSGTSTTPDTPSDTPIKFDSSKVGHELVPSTNKTLNTYETKYTKIYYTDNFAGSVQAAINDSDKVDKVYEDTLWWNKYPTLPNEKLKIYCVNQWDDGWIVTNRMDKKGTGEKGGGYQSFTDFSLSVVRLDTEGADKEDDFCSTIAHEFNHVCAIHNPVSFNTDSDMQNQEVSGHVYAFGGPSMKWNYKRLVPGTTNKAVYTNLSYWDEFNGGKITDQYETLYNKLATIEVYIWAKYGQEKCRDFQFDFYDGPQVTLDDTVKKELNIPLQQLLDDCYNWYQQN
ncbi:M28 family peptidase [Clostridium drakei]|uniref:Peptidase M28 domain-containing protein n=1 Tax=Clostridium drakei TaxID=332101 RepID=A0A2U8DKV5_9CLOT|nr:M28 family peptidase [Clostridium drakei]AWI03105.1 hypothetical protein B9W14_00810 [Clostridium drakei]